VSNASYGFSRRTQFEYTINVLATERNVEKTFTQLQPWSRHIVDINNTSADVDITVTGYAVVELSNGRTIDVEVFTQKVGFGNDEVLKDWGYMVTGRLKIIVLCDKDPTAAFDVEIIMLEV